jgi:hypothetical protein
MSFARSRRLRAALLLGLPSALVLSGVAASPAMAVPGAVFTQTNAAAGNAVQAYSRDDAGVLTPAGTVATGGTGTGAGLGSQGAVTLSRDGKVLLAVNAGSGDVTAFQARKARLEVSGRASSGGTMPVSVAIGDGVAYVLNAGGTPSVSALTVDDRGGIAPLPGSTRALPEGASGPAQVSITPTAARSSSPSG